MPEDTPQQPEQSLAEQVGNRRAARSRIVDLGHPAYPNRFAATVLVSDVVARWAGSDAAALEAESEPERRIAVPGRVLAIRKMGKAVFLDLSDGRQRVVLDGKPLAAHDRATALVFSPDSKHLAYAASADGQWFVVVNEKQQPPHVRVGEPVFSPDSQRLAYIALEADQRRTVGSGAPSSC